MSLVSGGTFPPRIGLMLLVLLVRPRRRTSLLTYVYADVLSNLPVVKSRAGRRGDGKARAPDYRREHFPPGCP